MIRAAVLLGVILATCDAFSGFGGGPWIVREKASARVAQLAAKRLMLRMSSGQPDAGRGADEDIAAAYFRDKEAFQKQELEEAARPKKVFDQVDPTQEAWRAEKQRKKEEEEAAVEAKMAAWMKAAADKKAEEGA
uniref:Uncharacterized protein n=1 Tax=Hemiselmis tepida TaxID=464990 RepID=A0A7S0VJV0_9CRYP